MIPVKWQWRLAQTLLSRVSKHSTQRGDLNEAQRPAERDMWFFIWYWNMAESASTTVVEDAVLAESLLVDELFFPRTFDVHPEKHGCILWLSDQCEALVQQVRSSARVLECGFGSSPAAERLTRMCEWTVFYLLRIFEKHGVLQMPNPNSC